MGSLHEREGIRTRWSATVYVRSTRCIHKEQSCFNNRRLKAAGCDLCEVLRPLNRLSKALLSYFEPLPRNEARKRKNGREHEAQ